MKIVSVTLLTLVLVVGVSYISRNESVNEEIITTKNEITTQAVTTVLTTKEETTEEKTEETITEIEETKSETVAETSVKNSITSAFIKKMHDKKSTIFSETENLGNVFYYDYEEPVYISTQEYYTICGIVMNEAGAYYGSYEGRVAVAQCIRNQIIREKKCGHSYDIETIRKVYGEHTTKTPSDEVRKAVTDVFYNHVVVTKEPIIAWCATGYESSWHRSQVYVCSYGGNSFYRLQDNLYYY